jgi:hypothetical protein
MMVTGVEFTIGLAVMQSIASSVLKLDASFSSNRDGIVTAVSGSGMIVAQWHGTSGLWDIAPQLAALYLRFKSLRQVGMHGAPLHVVLLVVPYPSMVIIQPPEPLASVLCRNPVLSTPTTQLASLVCSRCAYPAWAGGSFQGMMAASKTTGMPCSGWGIPSAP